MHSKGAGRIILIGLVMALAVMVVVAAGCASRTTSEKPAMGAKPMEPASNGQTGEMSCAMCNKGAPTPEKGAATLENGVQVVTITLKDGYYSPNEIAIKTGMPAKLVFTGQAKDCSGKPKIAELNKQADFTQTGEATMDLGTVKAGTYKITCGMGSPGGNLIVE